ncbi:SDR family oxidoreductase [filamentous cyanobacterium LEGE 11480]|uniref:SDR family oxidoreductase n=2 Tax=Romeriopsis TaxID=2992131 RepID=A0A928Z5G6_9CYAN|nr:SDR family oxidoreductase [Romeriopsis navalis LEGE 11480]
MSEETIFLAGASRGVGAEIAKQLVQKSLPTIALLRSDAAQSRLEASGIQVKFGDAMQLESLHQAMVGQGVTTVISTIGGMPEDGERVDFVGNRNLIDAAVAAGAKRFILVSSIGVGESAQALPPKALEVLGGALAAKAKAEQHLSASGLIYTIVRPGGLMQEPATGNGFLTTATNISGSIHRPDVAQLVCDCLVSEKSHGQTLAALDRHKVNGERAVSEFSL